MAAAGSVCFWSGETARYQNMVGQTMKTFLPSLAWLHEFVSRTAAGKSFCFPPIHQCLTSLSHHVIIRLAYSEISTHFILLLAYVDRGVASDKIFVAPFLISRENVLSSPTKSEGMFVGTVPNCFSDPIVSTNWLYSFSEAGKQVSWVICWGTILLYFLLFWLLDVFA